MSVTPFRWCLARAVTSTTLFVAIAGGCHGEQRGTNVQTHSSPGPPERDIANQAQVREAKPDSNGRDLAAGDAKASPGRAESPGPSAGAVPLALTFSSDGHSIRLWHKAAAVPSRGVILLVHGRTWSAIPDWDLRLPTQREEGGEAEDDPPEPASATNTTPPSQWSLMDQLVLSDFSVYAIDLRGYGATARDQSGWLTPQRAADDIVRALDWICAKTPQGRGDSGCQPGKRPVLLGWSMGGLSSQLAVQQHPRATRGLVLFGYPSALDKAWPTETLEDAAPAASNTRKNASADFRVKQVDKRVIEAYVEACMAADPTRADWTSMHEFNTLAPEAVEVPVLMLWGEHDPYVSAKEMDAFLQRSAVPGSAKAMIANADHAAHLEHAAPEFLAAVVRFVDGI